MFHLAVVLKKETSLTVVSMRSTRAYLSYIFTWTLPRRCLMQVPSMRVAKRCRSPAPAAGDLLAEKAGDLFGLHPQHRLAGELFIQGRQHLLGAEHQIGSVLHLQQAPVIALPEALVHRAALARVTIQDAVQCIELEAIANCPRARSHPGAQRHCHLGKADAPGFKLLRQPTMAVTIELQFERHQVGTRR